MNRRSLTASALSAALLIGAQAVRASEDPDVGAWQGAATFGPTMTDSRNWWPFGLQVSGGWRVNRHLVIEGLVIGPLQSSSWHGDSDHPDRQAFDLMAGVRAVGYLPLGGPWDAMAGVGYVGTFRHQDVRGGAHDTTGEALLTAGLMYRGPGRTAVGLEASVGATTHVPLIGLPLEQRC